MKNNLDITLIQTKLFWENPDKNFQHFENLLSKHSFPTDIYILPEMFTTGFSMKPKIFADGLFEKCLTWMQEQAIKYNAALTGSTMCADKGVYYNRLIWMQPDGTFYTYDKKHLFSYGNEPQHYTPGSKRIIVEYKGWRICPLICYDLRFPTWCRNTVDYDILIFVANWPDKRIYAWNQLLIARAIENVCYVACVNRVGDDDNHIYHSGHSAVIDYLGKILWTQKDVESICTITLDKSSLSAFRKTFTVLNDRDDIPGLF